MPIYRYRCTQCGAQEEHLQKISDPPVETCETCGGELSKQLTAAAFHLKGGGWYKDLYSSAKSDGGGSSAGSDAGDKSSGASDTGSAGKSDTGSGSGSGSDSSTPSSSTDKSGSSTTPSTAA